MSKQLYEEALADVKKVKQVAEDNAKRAVLEAVTPRIREFIDNALLGEPMDDEAPAEPGAPAPEGELMTDLVAIDPTAGVPVGNAGPAAGVGPPDASGKVTLDLDGMCSTEPGTPVPPPMFGAPPGLEDTDALGAGAPPGLGPQGGPDQEFEISLESIEALRPLAARRRPTLAEAIARLVEQVKAFKSAGRIVRSSRGYRVQIAQMISRVEDMYDHVQEKVTDRARKGSYENLLEASFRDLNKLQESTTMSQKTKKGQMNEADLTLKLTGLPDDVEDALDDVAVDLVTGDEEGEDELGGDELGDDEEGGDDLGDLDFGGDQGQEGGDQMESRRLSDDTIVEIDEKMLKREIARMRNIRENHTGTGGSETKPQSWGNGADHFDSFGGGKDEGEFDEQDIVDKSPAPGALPLGEADEDLDEAQDQMDEQDQEMDEADQDLDESDLDQAIDPNGKGGNNSQPKNAQARTPGDSFAVTRQEGLKRLGFEKKLQERAKARAVALKKEATLPRTAKNAKRLSEVKKEYALVARRFNESVTRAKKITQLVATATRKLQEARSNSGAARPAEVQADDSLRKKLAETNLFNAKLLYTNKLLQNEQLTTRQKAQVIKQLDTAKTVREAKLVYESLASTLAGSARPVTEGRDRTVLGSGSRATRPASTAALNEGYEAERWAQLAGITRR